MKKYILFFSSLFLFQFSPYLYAKDPVYGQVIELFNKHYPPIENAIYFVGSSTFERWNSSMRQDFSRFDIIPRGLGGSTFSDLIDYSYEIAIKYNPRGIFIYEGDNDLAAGKKSADVLNSLKKFIEISRLSIPNVKIFYVSIKPSLARKSLLPVILETNSKIKDYCGEGACVYIDVASKMLDEKGNVIEKYYVGGDGLHLNRDGYVLWTNLLKPYLNF